MKLFPRVTNSFVMTAALLAVVIGSLCFSVGEGLRLTPFPITALSQTQEDSTIVNVEETDVSLSKYGPLDVPVQKRGKRSSSHLLSASPARRELVVTFVIDTSEYERNDLDLLAHLSRPSGRAPPLNS